MLKTTIGDIMTEYVVMIEEDTTIMMASHMLLRFRINGILVTKKGDKNNIIGVITTTDLLKLLDKALSKPHKVTELDKLAVLPVGKVADKNIIKVRSYDKLEKAIAIMHRKKVHTLPVYNGDELVGIIGRHDILNIAFYNEALHEEISE